jgi:hypothetical protein
MSITEIIDVLFLAAGVQAAGKPIMESIPHAVSAKFPADYFARSPVLASDA